MARAAFNIGNTTEDTVNVYEINLVPVEEPEQKKLIQSEQLRFLLPLEMKNLLWLLLLI